MKNFKKIFKDIRHLKISSFKANLWSLFLLWLPLFMLAEMPVLSSWINSSLNVTAQDLILPSTLAFVLSLIITFCYISDYKKNKFTTYIAAVTTTFLFSGHYSDRFQSLGSKVGSIVDPMFHNPILVQDILIAIVYPVVIIVSGKLLAHFSRNLIQKLDWKTDVLAKGIFFAITIAFLLQLYSTGKMMYTEWPQFFYRPPDLKINAQNTSDRPDIYYIVLDRYASQSVFDNEYKKYGFNNQEFVNYLKEEGFSISPNAHNNYPYTAMSIASTMNASYDSDLVQKFASSPTQIMEPYYDATRYGSVIKNLKSLGYKYDLLGSWYETSNKSPLADHLYQVESQFTVLGKTYSLDEFPKNELNQSIFFHYINRGLKILHFSILTFQDANGYDSSLSNIRDLKYIANQKPGGKFVFAHILVPHDPFYFNADGSLNPNFGTDNVGEPIKEKYINQVKFINSQMKDVFNQIKTKSDGKAVIILQADEGPRPQDQNNNQPSSYYNGDMRQWSDSDLKMKFGNLAAYYIPKAAKADVETHADNANVFRLVFNTYFDTNLAYLPKCYYAYSVDILHPFIYADITKRITGQVNPACSSDSSFK